MNIKHLCSELCRAPGLAGYTDGVGAVIKRELGKYMTVGFDRLGSIVGVMGSGSKTLLLDAHLDSVGLVVTGIAKGGFVRFDKIGSPDVRTLVGSRVTVYTDGGEYEGVVCSTPPHLSSGDDNKISISSLHIDIGLDEAAARQAVSAGDRILIHSRQSHLLSGKISSHALDNRAGVAAVIRAVSLLSGRLKNISLAVCLSDREEVGSAAAACAVRGLGTVPYAALVVDVGFGRDMSTVTDEAIGLGKGPSIGISPVLSRELCKKLVSVCKYEQIPFQHDVMSPRTSTNADSISLCGEGVPSALLSIPLRNMHTPVEVVDAHDIELTARLIAAFACREDEENA